MATSLGVACGCGGDGGEAGTLVGTVHGQTFTIADGVSAMVGSGGLVGGAVLMSNDTGMCDDFGADKIHQNERGFSILLLDVGSGSDGLEATPPTAPGTFTVSGAAQPPMGMAATLHVFVTDGSCSDVQASEATGSSGTVTLSAVDGAEYTGSFDVMLDSGDHVTGTFSPEACPALSTVIGGSAAPACVP